MSEKQAGCVILAVYPSACVCAGALSVGALLLDPAPRRCQVLFCPRAVWCSGSETVCMDRFFVSNELLW